MVGFGAGLFEDLAWRRDDNGVCCDYKGRFPVGRVEFGFVYGECFLGCCRQDVFPWRQCVGKILGEFGGDGFDVCQADLGEELLAAWRLGGEDDTPTAEGIQGGDVEWWRGS